MALKYRNLDLEIFDARRDGGNGFRVRVDSSPAGDQALNEAEDITIPEDLTSRVRLLEKRSLDQQQLVDLGKQLGDLLFPPGARQMLIRSRERLRAAEGLRIRLRLDTHELARIPWEYAYVAGPASEGFLALDTQLSIVRSAIVGQAPPELTPVGTRALRLVALFCDPATPDWPKLQLDLELEKIKEALAPIIAISPEYLPNATLQDLEDALAPDAALDIFHFSGHGEFKGNLGAVRGTFDGEGFLVLVGEDGGPPLSFSAGKLAKNLRNRGVRLAVLGACEAGKSDGVNAWSGVAAALTREGIPAVVGMQFRVLDDNARYFSRAFYRAIAEGQPIDTAVSLGRLAIYNRNDLDRDWGVPVLYLRSAESTTVYEENILFPRPTEPAAPTPPPVPLDTLTEVAFNQPVPPPTQAVDKRKLREAIVGAFTIDELKSLCANIEADIEHDPLYGNKQLPVSVDVIGGATLPTIVLNLIQYLDNRGLLGYLVKAVRDEKPNLNI